MPEEKAVSQERRKLKCKARAAYLDRQRLGLEIVECKDIRNYLAPQPICDGCPGASIERRSSSGR
jgi:hypothetical protein